MPPAPPATAPAEDLSVLDGELVDIDECFPLYCALCAAIRRAVRCHPARYLHMPYETDPDSEKHREGEREVRRKIHLVTAPRV